MRIIVDVGAHTRFNPDPGSTINFKQTGWGQTLVDETQTVPQSVKDGHKVMRNDCQFLAFNLSTFPMIIEIK